MKRSRSMSFITAVIMLFSIIPCRAAGNIEGSFEKWLEEQENSIILRLVWSELAEISTELPSAVPTSVPTAEPTVAPTAVPTTTPEIEGWIEEQSEGTLITVVWPKLRTVLFETPEPEPTAEPTAAPTAEPTATPTAVPTAEPTATPEPDKPEYAMELDAENGSMSVYASNRSDEDKSIILMIAQYSEEGVLLGLKKKEIGIPAETTVPLEYSITLDYDTTEIKHIKGFVWNSLDEMIPLINSVEELRP